MDDTRLHLRFEKDEDKDNYLHYKIVIAKMIEVGYALGRVSVIYALENPTDAQLEYADSMARHILVNMMGMFPEDVSNEQLRSAIMSNAALDRLIDVEFSAGLMSLLEVIIHAAEAGKVSMGRLEGSIVDLILASEDTDNDSDTPGILELLEMIENLPVKKLLA